MTVVDRLTELERIDKLFEEIKRVLNASIDKKTGNMNVYLADFVAGEIGDIAVIINNNEKYKYRVATRQKTIKNIK